MAVCSAYKYASANTIQIVLFNQYPIVLAALVGTVNVLHWNFDKVIISLIHQIITTLTHASTAVAVDC